MGGFAAVTMGGFVAVTMGGFIAVVMGGFMAVTRRGFIAVTMGWFIAVTRGGFIAVTRGGFIAVTMGGFIAVTMGEFIAVTMGGFIAVTMGGFIAVTMGGTILCFPCATANTTSLTLRAHAPCMPQPCPEVGSGHINSCSIVKIINKSTGELSQYVRSCAASSIYNGCHDTQPGFMTCANVCYSDGCNTSSTALGVHRMSAQRHIYALVLALLLLCCWHRL
ncbi:hypothetical protein Btru_060910 [Bulinus truncatus]|nr:hypothetical protein Btru_060910 [Bulinus truncatus]